MEIPADSDILMVLKRKAFDRWLGDLEGLKRKDGKVRMMKELG